MRYILLLLFSIFLFAVVFSQNTVKQSNLQNGDLLFVHAKTEHLSGAIDRVTKNKNHTSYDHVALLEKDVNGTLYVLEASTKYGSHRYILDSFLTQINQSNVDVYRLQSQYKNAISSAIYEAKHLLGKPYNWSYILRDSSYYCSDFIERAFRKDSIFQLEPMTFINPLTGKIDDYWIRFYKKQKIKVPQGQLGCNPNGLASSTKLDYIGQLKINK